MSEAEPLLLRSIALAGMLAAAGALVACDPSDAMPVDAAVAAAFDATPRHEDGGPSVAPAEVDFVATLADPLSPARWRPGTVWLDSSREPEVPEGLLNADRSFFREAVGADGRGVLVDRRGPGVITRIWFTLGDLPAGITMGDGRIHVWIDGDELFPGGITLRELTGGATPGLPRPWVLTEDEASRGWIVTAPIAYQESVRMELETIPGSLMYYQVDGRDLPAGTPVTSFDPGASAEREALLEAAARLWRDHAHPGDDAPIEARAIAIDESVEQVIEGPEGAITTIEVTAPPEARETLRLTIEVDGSIAADAPLAWMTGTSTPTQPYSSGFVAADETRVRFFAPIPFTSGATVSVTNEDGPSVPVGLGVRVARMAIDRDVGRFHADCRSVTTTVAEDICERWPTASERTENVVLGSWSGARGQYAGSTHVMSAPTCWWFALETDHEVFVDGEYRMLGTGLEDYYGGAFYFQLGPYHSITSGAIAWRRGTSAADPGAETSLYRHHVVDTIPFESELRFEIETYISGTRWDGCTFFYSFDEA